MPEFVTAFAGRSKISSIFGPIFKTRNELTHNLLTTDQQKFVALRRVKPLMFGLLSRLFFFRHYQLVLVDRVEYNKKALLHSVRVAMGDWTDFDTARMVLKEGLEPVRAYVLSRKGNMALCPTPFIVNHTCDNGRRTVLFFNKKVSENRVEYISNENAPPVNASTRVIL